MLWAMTKVFYNMHFLTSFYNIHSSSVLSNLRVLIKMAFIKTFDML